MLAKVVKRFVERGRPSDVLDDVVVRGAAPHGLGFVSGHIAVVTALAYVAWPWLPRWGRWAAGAAVAAVFLTRMYVGAHLPLDMVGGAALGWAVGSLVLFVLGAPDPRPSLAKLKAVLAGHGLEVAGLEPVGTDPRRSTCYVTSGEPALFVKVVVAESRELDLLWRAVRRLTRRDRNRPVRFGTAHHEVEHEATMALLAARAGIAHGEPVPANVMVDGDGRPWLVDFDQAHAASDRALLEQDRADLLAALGVLVGPERAKRTSEATLV